MMLAGSVPASLEQVGRVCTSTPDIQPSRMGSATAILKHIFVGTDRVVTRVRQERDYNWNSEDSTTYYYHPDHLGSVSVVSNHRGSHMRGWSTYPLARCG